MLIVNENLCFHLRFVLFSSKVQIYIFPAEFEGEREEEEFVFRIICRLKHVSPDTTRHDLLSPLQTVVMESLVIENFGIAGWQNRK